MARRFFIDKDIRYMLPYVKKVGEDQFGNEYFEDNGTVENPQMKTRQRSVNAHQNSMVCDTLCVMISGSFGMAARTTSCSTFLWRPLLSRQSGSHGCTTWMIAFPLQVSLPRHQFQIRAPFAFSCQLIGWRRVYPIIAHVIAAAETSCCNSQQSFQRLFSETFTYPRPRVWTDLSVTIRRKAFPTY